MSTPGERVEEIMDYMARGQWSHHRAKLFAAKHRTQRREVERNAAEAGRTLARLYSGTPDQREAAKGEMLADLKHAQELALGATKTFPRKDGEPLVVDAPDLNAWAKITQIKATILGLMVHKVEHQALPTTPAAELIASIVESDELRPMLQAALAAKLEEAH